ncbi:MCE family protein [Nocardia abscessus]|uniref:MCE family protein n=1 Tax=Nocardia TaxID=1817 RepID=UPI0018947513|nr:MULTISPECIES: MCE family protein [Nocardia]MBF6222116.1 MCE family protein [Nocardia abscessus]MDE1672496.1 MCE family protein [Nocardia gipuzkoensis]
MKKRILGVAGAVMVVSLVVTGAYLGFRTVFGPRTIRAVFASATAIYQGDDVRVAGVEVGRIAAIHPRGTSTEMVLEVDRDVPIPADAKAVIVAQSLVGARYVQLTPAYRTQGPTLPDGGVIPLERTAVPVEWDEVKTQLTRLATELGPGMDLTGSVTGRFIDSAANAMADNGAKLRQTLAQLSGIGRVLADGSGDIVGIIADLQHFVTVLRDSDVQIVEFQNRLASLSSVLADSRSDLDAALSELSVAVGEVQRFVSANRDGASEQVQRLVNVTQNLVDHRDDVEELLHIFPTSIANFYNIYNPDTATEAGVFVLNNFSDPVQFVCSSIASLEKTTTAEAAQKCRDYLGPVLGLLNFNYLPFPVNPVHGPSARPESLIYTEDHLIPQVVATEGPPPPPRPSLADILFPGGRR